LLVVCNGAAKSGSTWLYNIVSNIAEFHWPDPQFLSNSNTKHPTIKEARLGGFLETEAYQNQNFISKNHYGREQHRDLLLSSAHTRILDMCRDTRDVIVSSYYDDCRRNGYTGSFGDYYWQSGRFLVDKVNRYHKVWGTPHSQILVTSYEALKTEFDDEVRKIGFFLGADLGEEDLARIDKASNIDSLRKSYRDDAQYNTRENPFFRKGEIGDWKNHFDAKMNRDYEKIERDGIGRFDPIYLRTRIRQKLHRIFI
jgi:hypothetical protein